MKRILFALTLMNVFNGYAQENLESVELKNELHFNALLPIAFKTFEVSYERNINENSSFGVSALLANENNFFIKYALTPYYRKYFSNGYAKGFFIEGFTMLNGSEIQQYTDIALGFGLGGKFITKDNFVATVNLGIGRNMGEEQHEELVLKGGVCLGYRF